MRETDMLESDASNLDVLDALVEPAAGEPNFAGLYMGDTGIAGPQGSQEILGDPLLHSWHQTTQAEDGSTEQADLRMDFQTVLDRLNPELRMIAAKLMDGQALTADEEARMPELRTVFAEAGMEPESRYPCSEPADEYHGQTETYLSSSQLKDFRRCPKLYHRKQLGLIPRKESEAFFIGEAGHTLILEGVETFNAKYAVGGPVNPSTGKPYGSLTKKFAEWAEAQGKPVLTEDQHRLIWNMAAAVDEHAEAKKLFSEGKPEQVCRAEYRGVPCQIRIDWLASRGIVDLKTCDDLTWFGADAKRYGYAHQLAFYRAVYALVVGQVVPVWLVAAEKKEPYRVGVWKVDPEILNHAQRENEAAIARLTYCRNTYTWPTDYEEVRVFDYV